MRARRRSSGSWSSPPCPLARRTAGAGRIQRRCARPAHLPRSEPEGMSTFSSATFLYHKDITINVIFCWRRNFFHIRWISVSGRGNPCRGAGLGAGWLWDCEPGKDKTHALRGDRYVLSICCIRRPHMKRALSGGCGTGLRQEIRAADAHFAAPQEPLAGSEQQGTPDRGRVSGSIDFNIDGGIDIISISPVAEPGGRVAADCRASGGSSAPAITGGGSSMSIAIIRAPARSSAACAALSRLS